MPDITPRYLVPFHPKDVAHRFTDVLIIGGGLAGLRAANAVSSSNSLMIVTKDQLQQSNSNYAQGGIAGVMHPEDNFENHIQDTLTAGGSLCDQDIVDMVIKEAPDRIRELMQWGANFDRNSGELSLGREGGHSHHRILHALGDSTGKEIIQAMIQWTRKLRNVSILENTFTLDLLTEDGICRGGSHSSKQRNDHGLGKADNPLYWWCRATLPGVDEPFSCHCRRPCVSVPSRRRAVRYGIHAISSNRSVHSRE